MVIVRGTDRPLFYQKHQDMCGRLPGFVVQGGCCLSFHCVGGETLLRLMFLHLYKPRWAFALLQCV